MDRQEELRSLAEAARVRIVRAAVPGGVPGVYVRSGEAALIALDEGLDAPAATCAGAEGLGRHLVGGEAAPEDRLAMGRTQRRARAWAYGWLVPLDALAEAMLLEDGNVYAACARLGVTEQYLQQALDHYREVYGARAQTARHWLQFMPWFEVGREGDVD